MLSLRATRLSALLARIWQADMVKADLVSAFVFLRELRGLLFMDSIAGSGRDWAGTVSAFAGEV